MVVLAAVEVGPLSLAQLVDRTGLSRATAHRLAVALEAHGLVRRDEEGRFCLGLRLISLGHEAAEAVPVWAAARPALAWLHEETGESVQSSDERPVGVEGVRTCRFMWAPHNLKNKHTLVTMYTQTSCN